MYKTIELRGPDGVLNRDSFSLDDPRDADRARTAMVRRREGWLATAFPNADLRIVETGGPASGMFDK